VASVGAIASMLTVIFGDGIGNLGLMGGCTAGAGLGWWGFLRDNSTKTVDRIVRCAFAAFTTLLLLRSLLEILGVV
jgi:hypothetical protein